MLRFSRTKSAVFLLSASCFVVGFGCHLIAGIDEKQLPQGTGGAGSTSSGSPSSGSMGSTSSSASGSTGSTGSGPGSTGSSGGPPPLLCGIGAQKPTSCESMPLCIPMAPHDSDECNCAACGRDCGEDGLCSAGLCAPKLLADRTGEFIYSSSSNGLAVYFAAFKENGLSTEFQKSTIFRVDYNQPSTMPATMLADVEGRVKVVAADCDRVFFAREYDPIFINGNNLLGRVGFVPKDGGPVTLLPLRAGQGQERDVEAMVAEKNFVFWTSPDGLNIWRNEAMATEPPFQIGTKSLDGDAIGLAVAPPYVYWSETSFKDPMIPKGYIRRALMGPGNPAGWHVDEITQFTGAPRGIAVDASHVYFSNAGPEVEPDAIMRVSQDGVGSTESVVISPIDPMQHFGYSVGVDMDFVYYITDIDGSGNTRRRRKDGGEDTSIANDDAFHENWIAVDNRRVYMVSPGSGQIHWVAR